MRFTAIVFSFSLISGPLYAVDFPLGDLIFFDRFDVKERLLNDTGQQFCDTGALFLVECPALGGPFGQDGEYGWDVTEPDDADGKAGFKFTKIDASGNPLPAAASDWSCVLDQRTGLIWESKQATGLHSDQDRYAWFQGDMASNGGNPGLADPGDVCFDYSTLDPASHCNTAAYVARVNAERLCGISNWQLPYPGELLSLVDYSLNPGQGALVRVEYFPLLWLHREQNANYWSALTYPLVTSNAVQLNYWNGSLFYDSAKTAPALLRLVAEERR